MDSSHFVQIRNKIKCKVVQHCTYVFVDGGGSSRRELRQLLGTLLKYLTLES